MIKVVLSPDAILDYDESFAWYAKRSSKAALEFEDQITSAIDQIARAHEECRKFDDVYRYVRLSRYPFFVIFRVEGNAAHILAIAHTSRQPSFWKQRDQA